MKLLYILPLFIFSAWGQVTEPPKDLDTFLAGDDLKLSRADHVLGEHLVNMVKFTEKGYINKDIISKVIKETEKSKHFFPFLPWLKAVNEISKLSKTSDIIQACKPYAQRKETLNLEKMLERTAGNYCRERALEAISRDIDKTNTISDEASFFIQENLKSFLTKKNKKNFAFFIQSQVSKPEILKKISQEVTTYSVMNEIVPSQEVLKDIVINEQITKLIQDKGFNLVQHKNVFYAEYGKLIELGYKEIDKNPPEDKVKQHFNYLKNYLELNQDHLPVGLCLGRLNDFSKAVFSRGKFKDLARDIFQYILKKNNKEIQEDALFFYLWTYLSNSEYKEVLKIAKKYDLLDGKVKILDPRLKFWLAYTYEALEEPKSALPIYEDIVFNHSLSYYAIMSVKKIQVLKPESPAVTFYASSTTKNPESLPFDPKALEQDYLSSLVRLRAWVKIDSQRLMNLELKRLKLHSMPKIMAAQSVEKQFQTRSDLHLLNAKIIFDSQNYLASFRYIYEILDKKEVAFSRSLLEILYPKPFLNELTSALKKSLDPLIVLSLIRQESVFNPLAKSPVGARGLMQLMPATARRMRRSVRDKHLVNPKINIELGTKYFSGLYKRYDGNLVYVLSAYNAGEGRVERWKTNLFDSDATILKNIESIPFLETRNYVKLIFRNIFFYKLLLENKELADTSEANKIFDVNLGFKN